MTLNRETLCSGTWLNHYSSDRFNIPESVLGFAMHCIMFEDDDPRIQPIVDRWGRGYFLVGYEHDLQLVHTTQIGSLILFDPKMKNLTGIHPESIAEEYKPLVRKALSNKQTIPLDLY